MHSNFNDLKNETMTAKEFIAKDLESRFGVDVEVHNQYYTGEQWVEQMEAYHQEKLKLLGICAVVGRSEQLKAVQKLKDFAYEVCPLHREDDLEEIMSSL